MADIRRGLSLQEDDGLIVFDSRAIIRYLAVKHGANTLVPKPGDFAALATFEEGMAVELGAFEPFAAAIVFQKIVSPCVFFISLYTRDGPDHRFSLMGGKTDEEKLAENLQQLETKLDVYETLLSKRKYLGGSVRILTTLFP